MNLFIGMLAWCIGFVATSAAIFSDRGDADHEELAEIMAYSLILWPIVGMIYLAEALSDYCEKK
jgi:hypothetical protein